MARCSPVPSPARILLVASLLSAPMLGAAPFTRGDADGSGALSITDPIRVLRFLFAGDEAVATCRDAADADDSGAAEITDAIYLLEYLFLGGPAPPAPFPGCGTDWSGDELDCREHAGCAGRNVFTYFGNELDADGVIFVIDRSTDFREELEIAKEETARVIEGFRSDVQFGMIFFNTVIIQFPPDGEPLLATPENKDTAISTLRSITAGRSNCPLRGLLSALQMAELLTASGPVLLFVTDGDLTCPGSDAQSYAQGTLEQVEAFNTRKIPIHAFGLNVFGDLSLDFMRRLAEVSGGTYTHVQ